MLDGRYLPLKLLGQGGFGAAFLARDRRTPGMRQCVVKLFQPSGNLNPAQLQVAQTLFEREAEVLEDLGNAHPYIPDLFAFFELAVPGLQPGKQDQFFYLVQEFIDGQTLEEELEQKGPLSSAEVMEMLEAILPVLTFVHEHDSIHRDIKPSNIMRHRNGSFYLLDFGAVKQATKAGGITKSTGIYSLGFAPPEQVSGGEVYPSTDLYALAVTCIMLLTGKQPNDLFDSYTNTWKWRSHATQLSEPLARVLDRMLLATPSQRFQSAAEVLQALRSRSTPVRSPSRSTPPASPPTSSTSPAPATFPHPQPTPSQPTQPPTPAPPAPSAPPASARSRSAISPFSTLELLLGAAFTGFEGGLIAVALVSFLGTSLLSAGFWVVLLAALVFFQARRIIERVDLLILAGITTAVVLFLVSRKLITAIVIPAIGNPLLSVVVIAVMAGLAAIALTTLFRLIYKLLSNVL